MMKIETFASGFSGYGGADLGLRAAGLEHTWGLEMEPELAEVYQANIGRCHVQSILESDPMKLEAVDWLHMSPVCKNFSAAKTNAAEAAFDIDCAKKVAEFIRVLQPKIFTLENVQAYGKSIAFNLIVNELNLCGYWSNWQVLNSADFGVPQSRKRLILRAIKGGFLPSLPPKTKHMGWYEAIADKVYHLPKSEFSEWQARSILSDRWLTARVKNHTPLLIENTGARSDRPLQTREPHKPCWTIRAMGHCGNWHRATALLDARVVQLDIPCLARLQGFPDDYQFSGVKSRDGKGLGNSVTPPLMKAIARNILGN
jgi:DNA (cytosine-5)-methyltransferase 1